MDAKEQLQKLEDWIYKYQKINGAPPVDEILMQIDLLKDESKKEVSEERELLIEFLHWFEVYGNDIFQLVDDKEEVVDDFLTSRNSEQK